MSAPTSEQVHLDAVERIETMLCASELADRVELIVRPLGQNRYRAASVDGSVEFERIDTGAGWEYVDTTVTGRHPLDDDAADRFIGHEVEREQRFPTRTENAYPHARDSIAQFFDAEHSPDLVATHTASHFVDGHLGQHGSLGVVQARAPFIAAGAGVRSDGIVDRSTRTINVAPTVAALLGLEAHPNGVGPTGRHRADAYLRRQDGGVETSVLTGDRAEHLVVFLLDGCNANLLFDVIDAGEAPHLRALLGRGTAYRHGMFASLPTATLANHTTAMTGAHPGHSGVLHNTWYDRARDHTPDLLAMSQMFHAMAHLNPDVETLHQAIHRNRPDAFTTATFEFCDTGADFSSFGLVRDGTAAHLPPLAETSHVDADAAHASDMYAFMSTVDHVSATHTIDAWRQVAGNPLPALSWCSLAVTDEAGHHFGPHGDGARAAVRDSDARIGDVLDAVDRAGALERTAILVIADHGMEQSDPSNDRGWSDELAATGVAHREVGGGLIYLT